TIELSGIKLFGSRYLGQLVLILPTTLYNHPYNRYTQESGRNVVSVPAVYTVTLLCRRPSPCPKLILPRPPSPASPPSRTSRAPTSRSPHIPPVTGARRSAVGCTTSAPGMTPTAPWRSTWNRRTTCTRAANPARTPRG